MDKDKKLLKEFKSPKPAREISLIFHKTQLKTTKTQLCNKHKQQKNQLHKISVNGV